MNQYRFSVIIPSYNRAEFIDEAVQSVLNQSFKDFELLIIDDASTDNSMSILEKYKDIPNVKVFKNASNMGVSYSRNFGIKNSNAEIIAFLDSDDIWLKHKLKAQDSFFRENPDIKICHTNEKWLKNNKHMNQKKIHRKQAGFFFKRSLERCLVSPSSVAIYKSIFTEISSFDENLRVCEDYDLWLKLNNSLYFGYLDEVFIIKRAGHKNQLSMIYPAMDQYRILSLINILMSKILTKENEILCQFELRKKLEILETGALKHKNKELIIFCQNQKEKLESI